MNHESLIRSENQTGSSDRTFGLVFSAVFALLACAPLWAGERIRYWALAVSAAFLLASLIAPSSLSGLNRLWTKLGRLMHRFVSPVALAVLFFAVLTPYSIIMRIFRKDPLCLRFQLDAPTYWIDRKISEKSKVDFMRQF
ncbi:MAG: SxtJ family membrane protein [Deltaproteobacteria bacterium]|nr:SxtJ family membrane protein [Deltaproteobacteria bacterium]